MKTRFIYFAIAWLLSLGHVMADDKIIINDVTVPQGGTAELVVGYEFTSTSSKVGFTLALGLPTGLSLEKDEDGLLICSKDETSIKTLSLSFAGDGNIAGQPSTENSTIKGTSGTLITLSLLADASLQVGSVIPVTVTKATFQERVDGSVKDINLEDFTFNVTIGEPDDGSIKFNETSTKLPNYTEGATGKVRMTRTIKGGTWNTLVLPFSLNKSNATAIFGENVKMAKYVGFTADYGDDLDNSTPLSITLNFTSYTIPGRGNLAGGTPILIKTENDINEPFTLDDVSLVASVKDVIGNDVTEDYTTLGKFTGTFVKTKVPNNGLFISDNKFWYSKGDTEIKAFRGWFELGAVLNQETSFAKIFYVIDGESTRINELEDGQIDDSTIYDLSGRRIEKPQQRGVYIVNGRKVLMK